MKILFNILLIFLLCTCKGKTFLHINDINTDIKNTTKLDVKDTVYYDYHDSILTFDIICVNTVPYTHLIILNAGKGINEHIDYADDKKSFFDHYNGNMKMLSNYFIDDTLFCEYKIYSDTLEFKFLGNGHPFFLKKDFFFIKRK